MNLFIVFALNYIITGFGKHGSCSPHVGPVYGGRQVHLKVLPNGVHKPFRH